MKILSIGYDTEKVYPIWTEEKAAVFAPPLLAPLKKVKSGGRVVVTAPLRPNVDANLLELSKSKTWFGTGVWNDKATISPEMYLTSIRLGFLEHPNDLISCQASEVIAIGDEGRYDFKSIASVWQTTFKKSFNKALTEFDPLFVDVVEMMFEKNRQESFRLEAPFIEIGYEIDSQCILPTGEFTMKISIKVSVAHNDLRDEDSKKWVDDGEARYEARQSFARGIGPRLNFFGYDLDFSRVDQDSPKIINMKEKE